MHIIWSRHLALISFLPWFLLTKHTAGSCTYRRRKLLPCEVKASLKHFWKLPCGFTPKMNSAFCFNSYCLLRHAPGRPQELLMPRGNAGLCNGPHFNTFACSTTSLVEPKWSWMHPSESTFAAAIDRCTWCQIERTALSCFALLNFAQRWGEDRKTTSKEGHLSGV